MWFVALIAATSLWRVTSPIDANTIIQRSVAANERDWQAAPSYNYFERDRTNGDKTYFVSMILGSPYSKLVAIDNEPLKPKQQAAEQRQLDKAIAERRAESPEERSRRSEAYWKDRQRDHQLIRQLTDAFNFRLLGQDKLGDRQVYVLQASPRPGYHPPSRDTSVLTGMQGKLWVDEQTFQWAKVEASVVRPVWIEGFLARVEPGTRFDLEYAPAGDGVWLPTHFSMWSEARVMFLFSHREQADQSYFGYARDLTSN